MTTLIRVNPGLKSMQRSFLYCTSFLYIIKICVCSRLLNTTKIVNHLVSIAQWYQLNVNCFSTNVNCLITKVLWSVALLFGNRFFLGSRRFPFIDFGLGKIERGINSIPSSTDSVRLNVNISEVELKIE